jgi:hypothetical protein
MNLVAKGGPWIEPTVIVGDCGCHNVVNAWYHSRVPLKGVLVGGWLAQPA